MLSRLALKNTTKRLETTIKLESSVISQKRFNRRDAHMDAVLEKYRSFADRQQVETEDKWDYPRFNGYPDIKPEFYQKRSPYVKYDDQQNRRNFNEPVNVNYDFYDVWSPDYYDFVNDRTALRWFLTYLGGLGAFGVVVYGLTGGHIDKPALPRNYPYGGLAKALGAADEEEAALLAARVDRTI